MLRKPVVSSMCSLVKNNNAFSYERFASSICCCKDYHDKLTLTRRLMHTQNANIRNHYVMPSKCMAYRGFIVQSSIVENVWKARLCMRNRKLGNSVSASTSIFVPFVRTFTTRSTTCRKKAGVSGESIKKSYYYVRNLALLLFGSYGAYKIWSSVRSATLANDEDEETRSTWSPYLPNTLASFLTVSAAKPLNDSQGSKNQDSSTSSKDSKVSRRQRFNFIADVLEVVQGAVVCIEVKDHSTSNWFGIPQVSSNGSGFIVKEDGLILTNAHVVASQQRNSITVKLHDGRCFAGFVEDVDYESDLATVRVKARGLPTLPLGCSSETRIGEWVVAVGSPLNLSNTVTAGIVSSTNRGANELGIHANDINYIQTDAAITFGNSGGPLLNLDGEAIGVNSMKVTPGISFAIPIDHVKKFLERAEIRRVSGKTRASRRYMGLTLLTLTDEIQKELEVRTGIRMVSQGVFVWQVVRGGPAYLAGLQPGDIITSINGEKMKTAGQVHDVVKTDDQLAIEVQRGKSKLTFIIVPENVI